MSRWLAPLLSLLLLLPMAARAQDAPPPEASAEPTKSAPVVGPTQLKDFSLDGTVTKEAAPSATPAPAPSPPTATPPAPDTRAAAPRAKPRAATAPGFASDRLEMTEAPRPERLPSAASPVADERPVLRPTPAPLAPPDLSPREDAGWWPWMVALLAATGVVVGLWWWRQQRLALEGSAAVETPVAAPVAAPLAASGASPRPAPAPPANRVMPPPPAAPPAAPPAPSVAKTVAPTDTIVARTVTSAGTIDARAPAPADTIVARSPAPAAPLTGGIVSRGLAPRLAFDFQPLWLEVDAEGNAALAYDLIVRNTGGAPARDVLVEARLVNAGPDQDREIAAFFQAPQGLGERVPVIPPQGRIEVRSRVALFADRYQPIRVEGRALLVPLVAFNALYKGGSSAGETQSSGSFLIGQERPGQAKMAPFVLGRARRFDGLGVRPHSGGIAPS